MPSVTSQELLIILAALTVGGLVKGVTGMGLPIIAVPVMAGFLGVERAVLTMIIPTLVLNGYQVWTHRSEAGQLPEWPRLLLAGIPGAIFGATVLYLASDWFLSTALALWILGYVLLRLLHPSVSLSMPTRMRWSPVVGAASGALQAAVGIAAPIVAPYADALGLRPRTYVFAVCASFGTFAAAHLVIVIVLRMYTKELLTQSLLAVIPAIAFTPAGIWLRQFISQRVFDLLIRSILVAMSARLLYVSWFPH